MERIPLVYVENGMAVVAGERSSAIDALRELRHENDLIYVMDMDGIRTNRANIDVYKKVSTKPFLWLDALPRRVEDVIDLVVAGATRVTIGHDASDDDLRQIVDMCESDIFVRTERPVETQRRVKRLGLAGLVVADTQRDTWDVETWRFSEDGSTVERIT